MVRAKYVGIAGYGAQENLFRLKVETNGELLLALARNDGVVKKLAPNEFEESLPDTLTNSIALLRVEYGHSDGGVALLGRKFPINSYVPASDQI